MPLRTRPVKQYALPKRVFALTARDRIVGKFWARKARIANAAIPLAASDEAKEKCRKAFKYVLVPYLTSIYVAEIAKTPLTRKFLTIDRLDETFVHCYFGFRKRG